MAQPFRVLLNCHVPDRGYSLTIATDHAEMQVYVSEQGRVIRAYEPRQTTVWADADKASSTPSRGQSKAS